MDYTYEAVVQPPLKPLEPWWWEDTGMPSYGIEEYLLSDQEARDEFNRFAQERWPENNQH